MPFGPLASRRLLPALIAAAIALTGCARARSADAGSDETSSVTTTVVASTLVASTLAAATEVASPVTTGGPAAATPGSGPHVTPSTGASSAVAGSYCAAALQAQAATNAFNALGADPHSTSDPAAVFDAYVATINQLAASAPSQLVADLQRNANAMAQLKPILAAAGYDVAKAFEDPAINNILTADVNAGSQRINDYNATTCGLNGASTTTSLVAP